MNKDRLFTSCFGLGRLPVAPGTWGSIPAVLVFVLLTSLGSNAIVTAFIMAVVVIAGSFICVRYSPLIIRKTGRQDPGEIVADELAGQAVTFLFVCDITKSEIWLIAIAGFILFRIFDIFKPWPIKGFEKLWQGWGILADDLMAGVYAGIILYLIKHFLLVRFIA